MKTTALASRSTSEEWNEFFDLIEKDGYAYLVYDADADPEYGPKELGEWEHRHLFALLLDEARAKHERVLTREPMHG